MAEQAEVFTTFDLFLSSCLLTLGDFKLMALDRSNPHKVEFCFLRSPGLDEAVQRYWTKDLLVEPQAFSANLKFLKNRIYSS